MHGEMCKNLEKLNFWYSKSVKYMLLPKYSKIYIQSFMQVRVQSFYFPFQNIYSKINIKSFIQARVRSFYFPFQNIYSKIYLQSFMQARVQSVYFPFQVRQIY